MNLTASDTHDKMLHQHLHLCICLFNYSTCNDIHYKRLCVPKLSYAVASHVEVSLKMIKHYGEETDKDKVSGVKGAQN